MSIWEQFRSGIIAIDLAKEKRVEPVFHYMQKKGLSWFSGREIVVSEDSEWARTIERDFFPPILKGDILCCEEKGIAIGLRESYKDKLISFKDIEEDDKRQIENYVKKMDGESKEYKVPTIYLKILLAKK